MHSRARISVPEPRWAEWRRADEGGIFAGQRHSSKPTVRFEVRDQSGWRPTATALRVSISNKCRLVCCRLQPAASQGLYLVVRIV